MCPSNETVIETHSTLFDNRVETLSGREPAAESCGKAKALPRDSPCTSVSPMVMAFADTEIEFLLTPYSRIL